MKTNLIRFLVVLFWVIPLTIISTHTHAREYWRGGCCLGPLYYPGYYAGYYSGYYPSYYVAPPPVVYATPAPTVTYVVPTPQATSAPQPLVQGALAADQASSIYTDEDGRTCRQFQSGPDIRGKACLQSDGSWKVVP